MIDEVTPAEFVQRRDAGEDLVLLDVREPRELDIAAVPGALHIRMSEVPARLGELDRDREIVVMCHSGVRRWRASCSSRATPGSPIWPAVFPVGAGNSIRPCGSIDMGTGGAAGRHRMVETGILLIYHTTTLVLLRA
jgi:rhodanese-related sulfurtransferase